MKKINNKSRIIIDGVIFQLQKGKNLGISRVWKNLIESLIDKGQGENIIYLDRGGSPDFQSIKKIRIPPYSYTEHDRHCDDLSGFCEQEKGDYFFSTYFTYPSESRIVKIMMIHDMIPEYMSYNLNQDRWIAKYKTILNSDAFIGVSKNTIDDLNRFYPFVSSKPKILVYNFVDSNTFVKKSNKAVKKFKEKYNINKPYILLVGRREEYKNAIQFFRVFSQWERKSEFQILCTGSGDLEYFLQTFISEGDCISIPYLGNDELSLAYSGAYALYYGSIYEGFGLPILEGYACGCPAIISETCSSVKEIGKGGYLSFNPKNDNSLAEALERLSVKRDELSKNGLLKTQEFSKENSINQFMQIFELELSPKNFGSENIIDKDSVLLNEGPTIVVVGYNRPDTLARLLNNLESSIYDSPTRLVISIDKGECNKTVELARNFNWSHGEKVFIPREKNLGLKEHVLVCGDLTQKYGSIILLEDDLFVSRYFYQYAKEALKYYDSDKSIAGISLYSHRYNESATLSFEPLKDDSDVFFLQLPSSWGQAWSANQWSSFRKWFKENPEIEPDSKVPPDVLYWPDTSWKKHFINYMVNTNKYFVYPSSVSYSTNCGDSGTHHIGKRTILQVPLLSLPRINRFKHFRSSDLKYDAFCEISPDFLKKNYEELNKYDFTVDLYGLKSPHLHKSEYFLTTRRVKKRERSFGLDLKPHEQNIINDFFGYEISLAKCSDLLFGSGVNGPKRRSYYFSIPEYLLGKHEEKSFIENSPKTIDSLRRLVLEGEAGALSLSLNNSSFIPIYKKSKTSRFCDPFDDLIDSKIDFDTFSKQVRIAADIPNIYLLPGGTAEVTEHERHVDLIDLCERENLNICLSTYMKPGQVENIHKITPKLSRLSILMFGEGEGTEKDIGEVVDLKNVLLEVKKIRKTLPELPVDMVFLVFRDNIKLLEKISDYIDEVNLNISFVFLYPGAVFEPGERDLFKESLSSSKQFIWDIKKHMASRKITLGYPRNFFLDETLDKRTCKYLWAREPIIHSGQGIQKCPYMKIDKKLQTKENDWFGGSMINSFNSPEYYEDRDKLLRGEYLSNCSGCVHSNLFH